MLTQLISTKHAALPASIVDGKLILSFPAAKTPVIWQMDLVNIKISALEIQNIEEETTLVLKNPKGDTIKVAAFNTHKDALDNLIAISNALAKAHGQIAGAQSDEKDSLNLHKYAGGKKSLFKTFLTLVGFITIFVLGSIFLINIISGPRTLNQQTASTANLSSNSAQDGTPISADDFLKGQ